MRYIILLAGLSCWLHAAPGKFDSSIFGEIKARNIGPAVMSGRITDIDCPRNDTNTIYVATAGGGVWKSENGGMSFKSIFDEHIQSIGCLTVDPNDPETVWVGTGEINTRNSVSYGDGLYRTKDGGKNWEKIGFSDSERIAEIRVHPKDSDVVYVAVLGHLWNDHEERGLYKTTDGGKNWERLLYVDESTGCIDVDLDPQEPDTLYAAMWQVRRWPYFFESGGPGSGLYKSTDGGKTFEKLRNGLPEGDLGRIDLDIAPSRPNRLYAMVESEETGLYRSDDMGQSWEKVSSAFGIKARPFYLSTVKVDPEDHNRVYNPSFQLTVSTDGGESFPGGIPFGSNVHPDHQAIWINPDNANEVVIGTDGGVYVSRDQARTFRFVANLPVSTFYRVSVDNQVPYRVYGGLQDNGSWVGPSSSPGGIGNEDWINVGFGDGFCVFADAEDPNYVYWEMQGGVLSRIDLTTFEVKNIVPYPEKGMEKNRFNWNSPFVPSPNNPKIIYFGSQYLYRSEDRGDSWTRMSPDLSTDDPEKQRQEESGGLTKDSTTAENHCTIFTIAESPKDAKLIWVGTDDGNLQRTLDGGANWTNMVANIPDLPAATWCSSVTPSPHRRETVYATFDGHRTGDKKPYVYRSDDLGETWTSLASEALTTHCHMIKQDPVNPDLLFLGTENGLFVSFDNGAQWVRFEGNFPHVSVRDMAFQEEEHDLVLATHGRGIYILDDLTPLRNLTTEVLEAKVAFLPSRPARMVIQNASPDMQGANNYVAANPPEGVHITYYLKRRHMFGDLNLEIYDSEGKLIKKMAGGKRKGINRVYWQMRGKPPKLGKSESISITTLAGSLFGPMVREGSYKVKMIKGEESYETEVELLPGRLNKHSKADRDLQHETVMKLYDMQQKLGFLADQLGNLREQCEARAEALGKGKLAKSLTERAEQLAAFHGRILTDVDNIFVARDRLRDEVIALYAAVSGYGGRPGESQVAQAEVFAAAIADLEKECEPALDVAGLNRSLAGKDQEPLTLLEWDSWLEQTESDSGGSLNKALVKAWHRLVGNRFGALHAGF